MTPYREALDELRAAKDADHRAEMTNKVYDMDVYAPRIKAAQGMVDVLTIDLTGTGSIDLVTPFLGVAKGHKDLIDTGHIYGGGDLIDWIGFITGHTGGRKAHIALCDELSETIRLLPLGADYCDLIYNRETGSRALFGFFRGDREFEGEARTMPCAILIAVLKYKVSLMRDGVRGDHGSGS